MRDSRKYQQEDEHIGKWITATIGKRILKMKNFSKEDRIMKKNFHSYKS